MSDPDNTPIHLPTDGGSCETTGSTEPRFLVIGNIVRPHGIRGEVVIEVMTDFPERFATPTSFYVGDASQADKRPVASARWHQGRVLLRFEGCNDRDQAETLRNQYVLVPLSEAKSLPEDTYYPHQLIGLHVVTTQGEDAGKITDVLFLAANDIYVVDGPRGQILLPAIAEVIREIDVEHGRVVVNVIPGLEWGTAVL